MADFGVSGSVDKIEYINGDSLISKTTLEGSILYMSPILKQMDKMVDIEHDVYKSDIYSMGILI